ncbi:MAG: response regulator [Acidobacteria bacterium]|nr:response regulator [Acidobacteriota bacterium]MCA1642545.1 response regulator [Acidobacteriota bacterium]
MKVLIVEDFADTRELLMMIVRLRGCVAAEAKDGQEAVELAASERPDLILMDLNLPVLDGWEATRRIRARRETSHIPVVAISAQCQGDWKERAIKAGARECLEKPVNFAAMDSLLDRYPALA